MRHVPEIKLIRTDTTLDLSQKAEKVCFGRGRAGRQTGGRLAPPLLAGIYPHKMFAPTHCSQLKWLGRPNRSHVEGKKTEKGEYETDNNDERVKRIQRGDDDES